MSKRETAAERRAREAQEALVIQVQWACEKHKRGYFMHWLVPNTLA